MNHSVYCAHKSRALNPRCQSLVLSQVFHEISKSPTNPLFNWRPRALTACFHVKGHLCLSPAEFLALKHESRILGHSSNPSCGFSMMEQVRLCAVWPMENWLGSSLNQIQGWLTVQVSYSRALEQGPLTAPRVRVTMNLIL